MQQRFSIGKLAMAMPLPQTTAQSRIADIAGRETDGVRGGDGEAYSRRQIVKQQRAAMRRVNTEWSI